MDTFQFSQIHINITIQSQRSSPSSPMANDNMETSLISSLSITYSPEN